MPKLDAYDNVTLTGKLLLFTLFVKALWKVESHVRPLSAKQGSNRFLCAVNSEHYKQVDKWQ